MTRALPRLPDRPLRLRVPIQPINWRELGLFVLSVMFPVIFWLMDPHLVRDVRLRNDWAAAAPDTARVVEVLCRRGCTTRIEHTVGAEQRLTTEPAFYLRPGAAPDGPFDVLRSRRNPDVVSTRIRQAMLWERVALVVGLTAFFMGVSVAAARTLWRERRTQRFARLSGLRLRAIPLKLFGHTPLGPLGAIWHYGAVDSAAPSHQLRLPLWAKPFALDEKRRLCLGVTDGNGPALLVDANLNMLKLTRRERVALGAPEGPSQSGKARDAPGAPQKYPCKHRGLVQSRHSGAHLW